MRGPAVFILSLFCWYRGVIFDKPIRGEVQTFKGHKRRESLSETKERKGKTDDLHVPSPCMNYYISEVTTPFSVRHIPIPDESHCNSRWGIPGEASLRM